MINRTYPESDWQTFKQALNVWFDFNDYREQLPFRFSRSMLAPNLAGLIREGKKEKAAVEDLKSAGFSRQLQCDVKRAFLLGNDKECVLQKFYGVKNGGAERSGLS